jgi:hypothetical protein
VPESTPNAQTQFVLIARTLLDAANGLKIAGGMPRRPFSEEQAAFNARSPELQRVSSVAKPLPGQ